MILVALAAFVVGFVCGGVFVWRLVDGDGNILICSKIDIKE